MIESPSKSARHLHGVRCVSFDLWDTLLVESMERPLNVSQVSALCDRVGCDRQSAVLAWQRAHDRYLASWSREEHFPPAAAARMITTELAPSVGVPEADLQREVQLALVIGAQDASVELTPRAREVIRCLTGAGLDVVVISDVGLAPADVLVEYLARTGLKRHLSAHIFSEQIGGYKPASRNFHAAMDAVGVRNPAQAVHVGDLTRTDVAGALSVGMRAVRYRGVFDDPQCAPAADIVIDELDTLLEIVLPCPMCGVDRGATYHATT